MSDFVKMYGSILDSSVWETSKETRLVWITMLAMATKQRGRVMANTSEIARAARVSMQECVLALAALAAPTDGDAQIVAVPGGWRLVPGYWSLPAARAWSRFAYSAVFERDQWRCRYCGAEGDLSVDHVIPRCQGGGDEEGNLAVACRSCNSRKGGRTPDQAGMVLR